MPEGGIFLPLYIVATPIGNMEDITLRALKTLREADAIIAEDTRTYRKLAARHSIPAKPVYSMYKGNESARADELLPKLQGGLEAALVSESGTPGVSDPGAFLVRRCHESGVRVIPIPGPSSLSAVLSAAGVYTNRVTFFGFLSKKKSVDDLADFLNRGSAVVFFDHPLRILKTLDRLAALVPAARLVLGRELTKLFEEIWVGRLSDVNAALGHRTLKGEIVAVVEPE